MLCGESSSPLPALAVGVTCSQLRVHSCFRPQGFFLIQGDVRRGTADSHNILTKTVALGFLKLQCSWVEYWKVISRLSQLPPCPFEAILPHEFKSCLAVLVAHVQQAQHCYGFVQTWAFDLQVIWPARVEGLFEKCATCEKSHYLSENLISTVLLPLIFTFGHFHYWGLCHQWGF